MSYAYRSLEDGQVVTSDEPRADLEELARWESIPVPGQAAPAPQTAEPISEPVTELSTEPAAPPPPPEEPKRRGNWGKK